MERHWVWPNNFIANGTQGDNVTSIMITPATEDQVLKYELSGSSPRHNYTGTNTTDRGGS